MILNTICIVKQTVIVVNVRKFFHFLTSSLFSHSLKCISDLTDLIFIGFVLSSVDSLLFASLHSVMIREDLVKV